MIPVTQTDTTQANGNCFNSCLASILEIPLEEVPDHNTESWCVDYNDWLRGFGLSMFSICVPKGFQEMTMEEKRYYAPGYTILSAESPRFDCTHAVVCLNGEIVHDPHPEREMGVGFWQQFRFFVALDAKELIKQ